MTRSVRYDNFMSQVKPFKPFVLFVLALIPVSAVMAQDTAIPTPAPAVEKQVDFRTSALRQLGLSRDQFQRIRTLNQERRPSMDAAQVRLRQANRALDEIIYADNASDADVQARLKDFQIAQAEVAKIRFLNELGVRRILTPEQLTRFRELRDKFEQTRAINNRALPGSKPLPREPQRPLQKFIRQNMGNREP